VSDRIRLAELRDDFGWDYMSELPYELFEQLQQLRGMENLLMDVASEPLGSKTRTSGTRS